MYYSRMQLRSIAFGIAELRKPPTWAVIVQIGIESNWTINRESSTGCVGLCQINPKDALNPGYGIPPCYIPLDPTLAVEYLCEYLVAAYKKHGTWGNAFLAYNVGMEGNFDTASAAYHKLAEAVTLIEGS